MWHEARRQERKIREMMVDYNKRSERRRVYYQRFRADPTQFLRLQGTAVRMAVEDDAHEIEAASSALMPWQGDRTNLIDRFDVRAHLDVIPEPDHTSLLREEPGESAVVDQKCHYERWRTLATNDLVGLEEDECLTQIAEDESLPIPKKEKKKQPGGAKIGFSYDSKQPASSSGSESEDDLPIDPDLDITFDVRDLDEENKDRLNAIAAESYCIPDFTRLHIEDKVEMELRVCEIRAEHSRAERVAKLSKMERRKEKDERRRMKDIPPHLRVDDPHRDPNKNRRDGGDKTDSSSDEEKTEQNIEISSARSSTYSKVKKFLVEPKPALPTFLRPKTASSSKLINLAATRKQLLSKTQETFDFGGVGNDTTSEEQSKSIPEFTAAKESKSEPQSRSRLRSSRSSRSRSSSGSSSSSRSRSRRRSSRSSRGRHRSRSRSRDDRRRRRRSSSSYSRSRSRERRQSPRRKPSPKRSPEKSTPSAAKKSDSLKALKPHERLKLKLANQLKKRQRDEKKKEAQLAEAKEQEAYERAAELRDMKRQMWEKEEEDYWKKREIEEKEYQEKKREGSEKRRESAREREGSEKRRERSGSRRRDRTRSPSRNAAKRSRSQTSTSPTKDKSTLNLVPDYSENDESEREKTPLRPKSSRRKTSEERKRSRDDKDRRNRDSQKRDFDRRWDEAERRREDDKRRELELEKRGRVRTSPNSWKSNDSVRERDRGREERRSSDFERRGDHDNRYGDSHRRGGY